MQLSKWGTIVAAYQGTNADDSGIRRSMTRVAHDEARHAQLAWDVHAWVLSRLSDSARRRVAEARVEAVRGLNVLVAPELPEELISKLGLPTPVQASAYVAQASREIWRVAA
jgi:hypothetical protein